MKLIQPRIRRSLVFGLALGAALIAVCGPRPGLAQSEKPDFVPLGTSINALMVALVDHAAHEIWEAASAASLTGRDWQTVEQHAIQIVASGTLVSIGGTGPEDRNWVKEPAWQEWSRALSEGGRAALMAAEHTDQRALQAAGQQIIDACFGCHDRFKPDAPTEGLLHVPHYDD